MTNPYAPPQHNDDVRETPWRWSLAAQVVCQAVVGAVCAMLVFAVDFGRMTNTGEVISVVLLFVTICVRGWFCQSTGQLVIAATALSCGLLGTLLLVGTLSGVLLFVMWTRFLAILLILPVCLTLVAWPVMAIGRDRRARRLDEASGTQDRLPNGN